MMQTTLSSSNSFRSARLCLRISSRLRRSSRRSTPRFDCVRTLCGGPLEYFDVKIRVMIGVVRVRTTSTRAGSILVVVGGDEQLVGGTSRSLRSWVCLRIGDDSTGWGPAGSGICWVETWSSWRLNYVRKLINRVAGHGNVHAAVGPRAVS